MSSGGRTVLITGAEGALGSVVTEKFLSSGRFKTVLATYLKEAPKASHSAEWIRMDITRADSIIQELNDREVDCLVHCAGGFRWSMTEELKDADLDFLFNVNARSSFLLARALLP